MDYLVEYLTKGFVIMLMVSLPCVLVAAGIGLVVGILQAVTQVQEQTIAAAPKILLVFLTIIILGSWYIKVLTDYVRQGTNLAFEVIPKTESFVLPPNYYKHSKPFMDEMYDTIKKNNQVENIMKNPGKIPWAEKLESAKYRPANKTANPTPNLIEKNKIMGR
ncbi:MAG: flagellar biosynthetic protein FliQ [Cyanobacteria bacterium SIG30]|nr:flagellar biosynthetic protein FliQ [Cyanobacteria bacterium SIG30]